MSIDNREAIFLELPPRPEFVGVARVTIAAFGRLHGFGEEQLDDLKIAVSEAVTNSVRAHADAEIDDALHLTAWMHDDTMNVEVTDRGVGFDPSTVPDLAKTPAPGSLEGGLGLVVIRSLFAETTFDRIESGGMRLRIVVKREAEPAGAPD